MAELKDLVQFALDKQPSKFKDAFGDLLSQRVVDRVEELKAEVAANMFGEAPEDEDDIEDLDDEEIEFDDEDLELTDEDEENLFADFDLDDEDMPVDDDDIEFEEDDDLNIEDEDEDSFNEEGPAVKEGLRNLAKMVGAKFKGAVRDVRAGMETEIARSKDNRRDEASYKKSKAR
jgi:hypothetical protein